MTREIRTWTRARNKKRVKIKWQFTKEKAGEKLARHYVSETKI